MPAPSSFDYAVLRAVPRVDREEFINAGVILYCLAQESLTARISLDVPRLIALDPTVDVETLRLHLEAVPRICRGGTDAGPIGVLSQKERWHWLVAPRSTQLQTGPVHSGLCSDPSATLDELMARHVDIPR